MNPSDGEVDVKHEKRLDLFQISGIFAYFGTNKDMSFLSRKLMNLNNKEGMKSEKSRRYFEATQKAIPKIKVLSPAEGKREGKIGENIEIDRKSIQLRIDKQPLHWEVSQGNLKLRAFKVLEKENFANGKTLSLEASERES